MQKNVNLLSGPVLPALTRLALPIMATSFIQMAYNLTDMIWIGRIGSGSLASVGAAGMYMMLSNGLAALPKMGGQITVGHALGAGRRDEAAKYAKNALQLSLLLGAAYGLLCLLFSSPFIGFFRLQSPKIAADAKIYLQITCGFVLFSFLNQTFTGIFTAMGNSRCSFLATTAGLLVNIVLDPLLIFGIGPIPRLNVLGAAQATVAAQAIVTLMFVCCASRDELIFRGVHTLRGMDLAAASSIVKIGAPSCMQSVIFTAISMIIARMVAGYGAAAVAVQKVGSQIESISWLTCEGFSCAVNSFVSQNYGAGNHSRIKKGYFCAMGIVLVWGTLCTLLLILCPAPIFKIFIREEAIIPMGVDYLVILGVSQLFMSVEITTAGAFCGHGRTIPPSVVSILLTAARIPFASALSHTPLGLNGVWWSITVSSILKGVFLFLWFLLFLKSKERRGLL